MATAAIALPSFLNQANRARESEAANYVGAVMRGQQAYYLEELTYATNVSQMDVAVPGGTDNYSYTDDPADTTAEDGAVAVTGQEAEFYGVPKAASLKGFGGIVYTNVTTQEQPVLICRGTTAGSGNTGNGQQSGGDLTCAVGESIGG